MESSVSLFSRSSSFPPSTFFLPRHIYSPSPSSPTSTSTSISSSFSPRLSPTDLERPSSPSPLSSSSSTTMKGAGRPCEPHLSPTLRPSSRRPSTPIETCAYTSTTEEGSDPYILHTTTEAQKQKQKKKTHYALLGVTPLASPKEIRSAYRQMALRYHPDVSPLHLLDMSTRLFADINEAYSTLSDPQKRADYDRSLAQDLFSPPFGSSPSAVPSSPSSMSVSSSPRPYTHLATGRIYPSMNSFYREWRRGAQN